MTKLAISLIGPALKAGLSKVELRPRIAAVVRHPQEHLDDPHFAGLARALHGPTTVSSFEERDAPAPWHRFGGDDLDRASVQQLENACRLPIAVAGALMPDAHLGYGLPIGGVLATDGAVIPYAVGVDIACRVKLTVLDLPPATLDKQPDRLVRAIESETRFGIGSQFTPQRRDHDVMDEDWSVSPVTRAYRDKAHAQLGTSGSGNHFIDFGVLTLDRDDLGLQAGQYLAMLTHSGSRGTGAAVCQHYSKIARQRRAGLPKELQHLAWLDLDSADGQEYWAAMQLMGKYAQANHALIHRHIARHLGAAVLLDIENHHNFAWEETHSGKRVIVHRKGATPADRGQVGIIPGSMAAPAYITRGKGLPESLNSAAHGAGRLMSRTQAKNTFHWNDVREHLKKRHVRVLSAGLDEVPFVYKDIDAVMAQQRDLVDVVARFDPRLVKMAPAGERAED